MITFKHFFTEKLNYPDATDLMQLIDRYRGYGYYVRMTDQLRWLPNLQSKQYRNHTLKIDTPEDRLKDNIISVNNLYSLSREHEPDGSARKTPNYLHILQLSNKYTHLDLEKVTEEQYQYFIKILNERLGVPILNFNDIESIKKIEKKLYNLADPMRMLDKDKSKYGLKLWDIKTYNSKPGVKLDLSIKNFAYIIKRSESMLDKCYRTIGVGSIDYSYNSRPGDYVMGDQTFAFYPDTFKLIETIPYKTQIHDFEFERYRMSKLKNVENIVALYKQGYRDKKTIAKKLHLHIDFVNNVIDNKGNLVSYVLPGGCIIDDNGNVIPPGHEPYRSKDYKKWMKKQEYLKRAKDA